MGMSAVKRQVLGSWAVLPSLFEPKASEGTRVLERVCADVRANAHVVVGSQTVEITCSAGVAAVNGAETAEDITQRADRALYVAKNAGRDRVVALTRDAKAQTSVRQWLETPSLEFQSPSTVH
jgi:predicted signal transduction protein with EAL and GGDEF domain